MTANAALPVLLISALVACSGADNGVFIDSDSDSSAASEKIAIVVGPSTSENDVVSLIDASTSDVIWEQAATEADIAVDPLGQFLYVLVGGGGPNDELWKVSIDSGEVVSTAPITQRVQYHWGNWSALGVTSDGRSVFVHTWSESGVRPTLAEDGRIQEPGDLTYTQSLDVFSAEDLKHETSVSLPTCEAGVLLSPEPRTMAMACSPGSRLLLIEFERTWEVTADIVLSEKGRAASPDEPPGTLSGAGLLGPQYIAVAHTDGRTAVIDLERRALIDEVWAPLDANQWVPHQGVLPTFPDGRMLVGVSPIDDRSDASSRSLLELEPDGLTFSMFAHAEGIRPFSVGLDQAYAATVKGRVVEVDRNEKASPRMVADRPGSSVRQVATITRAE